MFNQFFSSFLILFLLAAVVLPISAQEKIIMEGVSSVTLFTDESAEEVLPIVRRTKPEATLQEAKLYLAKKVAARDARRNLAEYVYGIDVKIENGKFVFDISPFADFMPDTGEYTYRVLSSGIVIAQRELLKVPDEIEGRREGLEPFEIMGQALKESDNILFLHRQAKLNAVENAFKKILQEKHPEVLENKQDAQGKVYILETLSDKGGTPYQVTIKVLVELP